MKIESVKDLEKVIRVCRKLGVDIIKLGDIEIVLGDKDPKMDNKRVNKRIKYEIEGIKLPGGIDENTRIEVPDIDTPDELTEEQKMFGSSDPAVWAEQ